MVPQKTITELQKLTFLHPGGVVSYTMFRPPPTDVCNTDVKRKTLPILIGLHGAGDQADGELVRHMLDGAGDVCAWTVLPAGVTAWSGDDWRKASLIPSRALTYLLVRYMGVWRRASCGGGYTGLDGCCFVEWSRNIS